VLLSRITIGLRKCGTGLCTNLFTECGYKFCWLLQAGRLRCLVYGKKQGALVRLFCGLALMIFLYFMSDVYLLVIIERVIAVLPCFWRG
jgi:hypothetical protein